MSKSSQSTSNSTPSSFQLNTSMDIDSGNTNIYPPSYLSKNYYKIVFPNNSTLSSSNSSYSLYSSHSSYSTSPSLQSQYYSCSNSVSTNSHFSE